MRILFAISLVALAALLWASVSIAQHIYRARVGRRRSRPHGGQPFAVPPAVAKPVVSDHPEHHRKAS